MTRAAIIRGDARSLPLADESIDCCVTSPPYWGLRDYGLPPIEWPAITYTPMPGLPDVEVPAMSCCLGLESTPEAFVGHMVEVFRDVWRVMKTAGTLWLDFGDSYASGAYGVGKRPGGGAQGDAWAGSSESRGERTRGLRDGRHSGKHTAISAKGPMVQPNRMPIDGLKPKDLVGIPWRVAFALQADGWWLRQDIIWSKPNPQPSSVLDRCTTSHEYMFLLSKSRIYHYDAAAIAEPAVGKGSGNAKRKDRSDHGGVGHNSNQAFGVPWDGAATRNRRSVWNITPQNYDGAHFAVMPEDLVEPCILAGCPEGGTVLDPFGGSGTVGRVAVKHRRHAVLVELNPNYIPLARRRVVDVQVGLPGLAS